MATVTLQIIAKDENKEIDRIIINYQKYFDAVQIAIDDEESFKICTSAYHQFFPQIEFFKYEWCGDFAHKRNWLADKCKTDYYFTIDADDEIINPELIREVIKDAELRKYNIVYGYYIYAVDEDGNPNAAHWKERLVKNTSNLQWNKKIHENIVPEVMTGHNFTLDERLKVKHLIDYEHSVKSNERNLKYLLEEYKQDGEKTDPRTIAYIGRVLFGFGELDKARYFLEKHIQLSGWDEDRHLSWCQLADLHRLNKDYKQAIACAFEALAEKPELPDSYLRLHDIYFDQEQWIKAIEWAEQGLKKETPRNFIVIDPSSYTWRPALSLSFCYFNTNDFEKAVKLFDFAKKLAPSSEFIKQNEKIYYEALEHSRYIDKLLWLVEFNKANNGNVKKLIESIPDCLSENSTVALLKTRYLDPKNWSKKSVVIYCGETFPWSPKSTETGIGGSEEAVINISKELTKLGYEVTVYNSCGDNEGNYDGVQYLNSVRFNPRDNFNIIISWRCNIFQFYIQGINKIVWIHDLPHLELTEETIKTFDKIVVLSKYHASLLPKIVPDNKIYISTNGINPDDFMGLDDIVRNPKRIIYASSYDRGLETILQNWTTIRESIPDAEIHCYYGWNTYLDYMRRGLLKDDGFYDRIQKLFKQEGVFEHGRIGHKELAKEYRKAGILAYPCTYAGEINCIALTKAIASGCFPLTNDFAVLPERNTYGMVVKDERFFHSLLTLLRKGDIGIKNDGYIEANSWKKVAEDWDINLFPPEVETVVENRAEWTWRQLDRLKTIVDIGSNKGHLFEDWDRSKITSVDIDLYDLPNFVRANADNLPFPDNHFDQAVLAEIVEHTKDPIKVLSEAHRVANKVIITVPYEYEWDTNLEPFAKLEDKRKRSNFEESVKSANPAKEIHDDGYAHLFHETFYTPELLRDHLVQAGFSEFKIIKIRFGKWCWLGAICQK